MEIIVLQYFVPCFYLGCYLVIYFLLHKNHVIFQENIKLIEGNMLEIEVFVFAVIHPVVIIFMLLLVF